MITIDHTMSWIIWPLLIFGLMAIRRGRRWDRWARREMGARWDNQPQGFDAEPLLKELEAQRAEMDEMASRLAELENRADFTERMLSSPREDAVSHGP